MDKHTPLKNMEITKEGDKLGPSEKVTPPTYDELTTCIKTFFGADGLEMTKSFDEGMAKTVEEPTNIVDFMLNLNDLTYHYISSKNTDITLQDKNNLKELHNGIQSVIRVISQYDSNLACKEFYAYIIGYVVKTLRNFYYDRPG